MGRRHESGISLVEVVVAGAIAVFVLLAALQLVRLFADSTLTLNTRLDTQTAIDRLTERLSTEAASAWAVYPPPTDVLGQDNSDGHEIDFFSEDGAHRPYVWAYRYDSQAKTITRYTVTNGAPLAGEVFGAKIDAFSAEIGDANQLSNAGSVFYDPLLASAVVPAVHYEFSAYPQAYGGNWLVHLRITGAGVDRTETLASGAAPTTFTVVAEYTPTPMPTAPPTTAPLTPPPAPTGASTTPPPLPTATPAAPTPSPSPTPKPTSTPASGTTTLPYTVQGTCALSRFGFWKCTGTIDVTTSSATCNDTGSFAFPGLSVSGGVTRMRNTGTIQAVSAPSSTLQWSNALSQAYDELKQYAVNTFTNGSASPPGAVNPALSTPTAGTQTLTGCP